MQMSMGMPSGQVHGSILFCLSSISSGRRDPGGMRIELELILIFECLKIYIHKTAQVPQLQYA